jgi:hypothetical protein
MIIQVNRDCPGQSPLKQWAFRCQWHQINATFMRASSASRGYSKRYGSGDNQRTINARFIKAPQVIEEDSFLDADNGTHGQGWVSAGLLDDVGPLAVGGLGADCSPAARRAHGLAAGILAVAADP